MSCLRLLTLLSSLFSIAAIPLCGLATIAAPPRTDRLLSLTQSLPQQQQNNRSTNGEFKIPPSGVINLVKELNLSPDQIQRLQQLRKNAQGRTIERRQALQIAKQELTQLLQGNASSSQIRQKRQQVQSLQREIADTNFEQTLAIREILTPEQRVKLQQILAQRRQNRLNYQN
jgi:periplasmic protein CpxP/Spy